MEDQTRRGFLVLAGTGAAVAGMAAVADAAPKKTSDKSNEAVTVPDGASGPLVAHVNDVTADEVSLMVGEREVVVRDKDLVARLARAAE